MRILLFWGSDSVRSNKFWIIIISAILLISAVAVFLLHKSASGDSLANIYQDGVCIHSVDLSSVETAYTLDVSGKFENIVSVERGRICVSESSCPDGICVNQGWISDGTVPVVCLPNGLVIQIESGSDAGIDAIAR